MVAYDETPEPAHLAFSNTAYKKGRLLMTPVLLNNNCTTEINNNQCNNNQLQVNALDWKCQCYAPTYYTVELIALIH